VSSTIPYTGGNGGTHSGQTVTSTGVTGLTATLTAGSFASGSDSLTYTITGTPTSDGTASFAINIGGQTCSLTRTVITSSCPTSVTFTYNGASVTYGTVSSSTGKCWLDRNLGASRVATISTDAESYGDLFQWGRAADGHQLINRFAGDGKTTSSATAGTVAAGTEGTNFITINTSPEDWLSTQDATRWGDPTDTVKGVHDPCPSGWRLPSKDEFDAERNNGGTGFWGTGTLQNNAAGAYNSVLKLPMAGYRDFRTGSLYAVGTYGSFWSSTVSGTNASYLGFDSSNAYVSTYLRADGNSVRCLKD
jgi:uncharacterized protein (TIGR02145 family)